MYVIVVVIVWHCYCMSLLSLLLLLLFYCYCFLSHYNIVSIVYNIAVCLILRCGERVTLQNGLRSALKVVGCHLLAQLCLHRVDLPALVVGQVLGGDAPAGARVAELAHDNGASDTVHMDEPLPHVAQIQQGGNMVLGQDGDAEGILLEANVLGEPTRF